MDKDYLLTFNYTDSEGFYNSDYSWFEVYEELIQYVDDMKLNGRKCGMSDFKVIEIIKINSCEILHECDDEYEEE